MDNENGGPEKYPPLKSREEIAFRTKRIGEHGSGRTKPRESTPTTEVVVEDLKAKIQKQDPQAILESLANSEETIRVLREPLEAEAEPPGEDLLAEALQREKEASNAAERLEYNATVNETVTRIVKQFTDAYKDQAEKAANDLDPATIEGSKAFVVPLHLSPRTVGDQVVYYDRAQVGFHIRLDKHNESAGFLRRRKVTEKHVELDNVHIPISVQIHGGEDSTYQTWVEDIVCEDDKGQQVALIKSLENEEDVEGAELAVGEPGSPLQELLHISEHLNLADNEGLVRELFRIEGYLDPKLVEVLRGPFMGITLAIPQKGSQEIPRLLLTAGWDEKIYIHTRADGSHVFNTVPRRYQVDAATLLARASEQHSETELSWRNKDSAYFGKKQLTVEDMANITTQLLEVVPTDTL